jgi:CSLREA domain-containing protein
MERSTYFRIFTLLAVIAAALLMAALMVYGTASAQVSTASTITVNTIADDATVNGNCTLREAIQAANTNAAVDLCPTGSATGQDTILFARGVTGKILLNSLLPNVTDAKGLIIDGRTNAITLSGNKKVEILLVFPGGQLTLRNLTVADGKNFDGAGVANAIGGSLEVFNSTFSGNSTTNGGAGGGISNGGLLNVTNSTFSNNSAPNGVGGGILNGGTLAVTNSTFSGNSAPNGGGGAINNNNSNSAMSVVNSTFSGNSANLGGGGISNLGQLFLTNDTFSGNSAGSNSGGGIGNFGTAATAKLLNTIVANSPSGGNCHGKITDGGYNISSDRSCRFIQPTSKNATNPKLAASLANNGGPTRTIALLKGSPALNAIPKGKSRCAPNPNPVRTDQRGVKRPQGTACDIGAYEKVVVRRHHH